MKATFWASCMITMALAGPVSAQVLEMPEAPMPEPESVEPQAMEPEPMEPGAPEAMMPESVEPVPEQPSQTLTVPGRGMTKDQVEERFGTPPEKIGAVGEPPISRWVYSGFTVYFEFDRVIHSVSNH